MDDERIDFSPLDPSQDELRWARLVNDVAARAVAERRARLSVAGQLVRWARPGLALAAGLCLLTWASGWLGRSVPATDGKPTALTVAEWAANHQLPDPADLLQTLRGY
jgi:hypothetical protein